MYVIKTIKGQGFDCYLAGGTIRDLILGDEPKDWDLATNIHRKELSKLFQNQLSIKSDYHVSKLIFDDTEFQIAEFRNEGDYKDGRHPDFIKTGVTLEEDARRRDFTVNAIYYDPIKSKIFDHVDGMVDIKKKQIRTIGEPSTRFSEDHLRILRAIRLAGKLNFKIEKKTFSGIVSTSSLTKKIAGERITSEISSMLLSKNTFHTIELLAKSKILHLLFSRDLSLPEFNEKFLKDFKHTKKIFQSIFTTSLPVLWAIFLRSLYTNHNDRKGSSKVSPVSEQICDEISNLLKLRLKFNNAKKNHILAIFQNQDAITNSNRKESKIWKRTLRKPFFKEALEFYGIMRTSKGKDLEIFDFWQEKLANTSPSEFNPKMLIKGNDLIKLGFKEGPELHKILNLIEEEQLENKIKNKEDAIEFIVRKFKKSIN